MNILLVSDCYPPEIRLVSYMVKDLGEGLALKGHRVVVVTSWPRYNLAPETDRRSFKTLSVENNIKVIRVKTLPHHKVNSLIRGISQLCLPYLFFRKIRKHVKDTIDVVIVCSPPLPLAMLGIKIKEVHGAKYILNIYDIFPQNAIDLGILKNRLIIKFFEQMENKIYEHADRIISCTEGSKQFLIKNKGIHPQKISAIPQWADFGFFENIGTNHTFREKFKLSNKFLLLFAGVMGPSQHLDFLIDVARKISDVPDICFLFVGDGTEKKRLQNMAVESGLENVKFYPYMSGKDYAFLTKEADVGMVCISNKNSTDIVPGKIIGFMAASLPIVAFLNRESEAHQLIKEARCGYSMLSDDPQKAADLIRDVFNNEKDKLKEYGHNGFMYASAHFSKKTCIDKLEADIANLIIQNKKG